MTKNDIINIEDLAKDFEQRIMDNNYYEDVIIKYRGKDVGCRIRPIPQFEFNKIIKGKNLNNNEDLMNFNLDIVTYSLLNKYDNEPFKKDDLMKVFPIGLITLISEKSLFISGLIDEEAKENMELFLKQNVKL